MKNKLLIAFIAILSFNACIKIEINTNRENKRGYWIAELKNYSNNTSIRSDTFLIHFMDSSMASYQLIKPNCSITNDTCWDENKSIVTWKSLLSNNIGSDTINMMKMFLANSGGDLYAEVSISKNLEIWEYTSWDLFGGGTKIKRTLSLIKK